MYFIALVTITDAERGKTLCDKSRFWQSKYKSSVIVQVSFVLAVYQVLCQIRGIRRAYSLKRETLSRNSALEPFERV